MFKNKIILISITCYLFAFPNVMKAISLDSLGTGVMNGITYIMHQVEKETLYAIARRYGVRVADIQKMNPEIKSGLIMGQKIKVPYTFYDWSLYQYHKIEAGQTLYSISKMYNTPLENIQKWNKLSSNELIQGMWLAVKEQSEKPKVDFINEDKRVQSDEQVIKNVTNDKSNSGIAAESVSSYFKIKVAKYISTQDEGFYLGLHPTLTAGTIIRVFDEEKKVKIYVRIAGKPTDAQKNNGSGIGLWLTPKAIEALRAVENQSTLTLELLPDN